MPDLATPFAFSDKKGKSYIVESVGLSDVSATFSDSGEEITLSLCCCLTDLGTFSCCSRMRRDRICLEVGRRLIGLGSTNPDRCGPGLETEFKIQPTTTSGVLAVKIGLQSCCCAPGSASLRRFGAHSGAFYAGEHVNVDGFCITCFHPLVLPAPRVLKSEGVKGEEAHFKGASPTF